jgi:hypothetical protein
MKINQRSQNMTKSNNLDKRNKLNSDVLTSINIQIEDGVALILGC